MGIKAIRGDGEFLNIVRFRFSYDPSCVTVRDIRPIERIGVSYSIDNVNGVVNATAVGFADPFKNLHAGEQMLQINTNLGASALTECQVDIQLVDVEDELGQDVPIVPLPSSYMLFLRGDAKANGVVDSVDKKWVNQYLLGQRPACNTVITLKCVHVVNAASVNHNGKLGDAITGKDRNFLRDYIKGTRDPFFKKY